MTNISDHLTTLELSKQLHESGFVRESNFYWLDFKEAGYKDNEMDYALETLYDLGGRGHVVFVDKEKRIAIFMHNYEIKEKGFYPAYLSSELGEALPAKIKIKGYIHTLRCWKNQKTGCFVVFYSPKTKGAWFTHRNETEARGLLLLYLIKNQLIEGGDK